MWYMDSKGYQTKYYNSLISIFPEHGERVEVYVGKKTTYMIFPWLLSDRVRKRKNHFEIQNPEREN